MGRIEHHVDLLLETESALVTNISKLFGPAFNVWEQDGEIQINAKGLGNVEIFEGSIEPGGIALLVSIFVREELTGTGRMLIRKFERACKIARAHKIMGNAMGGSDEFWRKMGYKLSRDEDPDYEEDNNVFWKDI